MAENYFYSKHSAQEMENVFDGAVLFNEGQTLSTSQKAQARANIGAGSENTGFQILGYFLTLEEMKESLQVPPQAGDAYGIAVFRLTTDTAPEAGIKYYTRSGSGTTEDPYTYTLFEGSSFETGVDYYVIAYYDTYVYDGASMDWLDIGPINEGEFIDDSEISPILTWSSQKIKNELDAIDLSALIDDSDTAADTTWSSQKIDSAIEEEVQTVPKPNLLENWYFVGGGSQQGYGVFPLNSNGQTSYTGIGDTIDRWRFNNSGWTLNVNAGGISLVNNGGGWVQFVQTLSSGQSAGLAGKTVTLSFQTADGLVASSATIPTTLPTSDTQITSTAVLSGTYAHIRCANGSIYVRITGNASGTSPLQAIKLELGSTQTLAHQENGVWVLNEVPSYGEEFSETVLSRAPYYYEDFSTTSGSGEYYGWYRGTSDKWIGDRLSKLRAMFILRAQNNIPAMVFMADDMQYAYVVSAQPGKQIQARFVFER